MLSSYELIHYVAKHLLTQGVKAVDKDGSCRYRIEVSGHMFMCAAGCCVSNEMYEKYKATIEGNGIAGLMGKFKSGQYENTLAEIFNTNELDLLKQLQMIHDGLEPKYWKGALAFIAQMNGVAPSFLEAY